MSTSSAKEERWANHPMTCLICEREWRAVFPVFPEAPERLECPGCGYMNEWRDDHADE